MTSNALLVESDNNQITDSAVNQENKALFDLPVDYHVSQKIKSKIWSNEFADFGHLLQVNQNAMIVFKEFETKKLTNHPFLRYSECCVAFEVFVAIYSKSTPITQPCLMKYAVVF